VTALPPAANDLILFEAALSIGLLDENRQPYLQRIRAAAARHPDDPLAMRVLAHAEALYGDGAAADRLLDRLLANAPTDAELLYLKGMRYLVAAESDNPPDGAAAAARTWLARARAADGSHYQILHRYVQSLRGEPGYVSDETRDMLLLANRLAPQVASITLNAASMLIAHRDYFEAIQLLAPLAANPHEPGSAQAARQLLAEAIQQANERRGPRPVGRDADPEDERAATDKEQG
jgi:tetratricopeptide (TPR) repeat protein